MNPEDAEITRLKESYANTCLIVETNFENALAEKDAEIAKLRKRCALLDSLLGEALRHGYLNERECPPTWLAEAKMTVTDLDKFKDILNSAARGEDQ